MANLTVTLLMTLFSERLMGSITATIGAIYLTLTDLPIKWSIMSNTRADKSVRFYLMIWWPTTSWQESFSLARLIVIRGARPNTVLNLFRSHSALVTFKSRFTDFIETYERDFATNDISEMKITENQRQNNSDENNSDVTLTLEFYSRHRPFLVLRSLVM